MVQRPLRKRFQHPWLVSGSWPTLHDEGRSGEILNTLNTPNSGYVQEGPVTLGMELKSPYPELGVVTTIACLHMNRPQPLPGSGLVCCAMVIARCSGVPE